MTQILYEYFGAFSNRTHESNILISRDVSIAAFLVEIRDWLF